MKVGVITFHSAHNFGASLQTWALQKILKNYKLEPYVIHYHPKVIDKIYDPIRVVGIKRPFRIVSLYFKKREKLKRYYHYNKFIQTSFSLLGDFPDYQTLKDSAPKLDFYITGSDQVWNGQHTKGFDPAYYLDFTEENAVKISYGASIGENRIPAYYQTEVAKSLSSFHFISVREESAKEVIQKFAPAKVQVETVLDPTLLLEKKDYEELLPPSFVSEKYIFVYMMEKNKELISFANRISKTLGIPIIGRHQKSHFKNEIATCYGKLPGDFIRLIDSAELVITNSFHGTAFSILCETPFFSMLHSSTGSRTVDLLNSLNLSSHLVTSLTECIDLEKAKFTDTEDLKKRLSWLRMHSLNFLENALSLNEKSKLVHCPTAIRKDQCYGCLACKEICPTHAIRMEADQEGFLYPITDETACIHCNQCNKVCIRKNPQTVSSQGKEPIVYAALLKDLETRLKSSSGAVFPALARYVIENGGFVVGVAFNQKMKAVSILVDKLEDLPRLYGSKYVKSDFNGIFPKIKELLLDGKVVLYSGLPCECAGLRAFLSKDYPNLIICEILCHSAPSPKILSKYIKYLGKKYKSPVTHLEFRNKSTGWETFRCSMVIGFENGHEIKTKAQNNPYFKAFQNSLTSRMSCSHCHYVFGNRVGDFTIGDFWGIKDVDPTMYDEKGTSMVLLNTEKAKNVWSNIENQFLYKESTLTTAFLKNHKRPIKEKLERMDLFQALGTEKINVLLKKLGN